MIMRPRAMRIPPAALAALSGIAAMGADLAAQAGAGTSRITITGSPAFEAWSFANGGLAQPTIGGTATVPLSKVTQISVPLVLAVPLGGGNWRLDVAGGFASSKVTLSEEDAALNTDSYTLSGITDTRLRLSGRLAGDNVLFTLGLNAPTGKTELDPEELSALRVVAAPALGLQIPQLGGGGGGTVGLVVGREFNDWAWAVGASYELRSGYAPIVFASGIPSPDFNPGDVIHFSVGGDGLVGRNEMSVSLGADIFSEDELGSSGGSAPPGSKLGPIFTAEWRLRLASTRLQEFSISLMDRFRTSYSRNGQTVEGSSGNYLDATVLVAHAVSERSSVSWEISGRHHTGLKSDSTLTSAAMSGAGLRVSFSQQLSSGGVIQPFGQFRIANLKNGNETGSATGFSIGLTVLRGF